MKKKTKKKRNIFFRLAIIAFSIYTVYNFVQLQGLISDRQKFIDELRDEMQRVQVENEVLQNQCDNYEQYLEQKAREQGMARSGETVYIESPGN